MRLQRYDRYDMAAAAEVVLAQASLITKSLPAFCMLRTDHKYEWEHAYIKKATAVQQASKWHCITCHSVVVAARCIPAAGSNVVQTFPSWPS
jgi:hypothetical protein